MKRFLFCVFIYCLSPNLYARSPSEPNSHHLGLGLTGYSFLNDLKEQFGNTLGYKLTYRYLFPFIEDYKPGIGLSIQYFNAKKNGFDNVNWIITPEISSIVYDEFVPVGIIGGFDINTWSQSKVYDRREILHEDILYGMNIGFFTFTSFAPYGHLQYLLAYHLQQFDTKSSFFELALQYVWDF